MAKRVWVPTVVIDGNCVTSRSPGTAIEFALTLVSSLFNENKAAEVAGRMPVTF